MKPAGTPGLAHLRLMLRLVGLNALRHVVLDVVVVERLIVIVATIWAEEVGEWNGIAIGVRYNHATYGV